MPKITLVLSSFMGFMSVWLALQVIKNRRKHKISFGDGGSQSAMNVRQLKAVNRMLEAGPNSFQGGMTNRKYVSLNKVSPETAKRDLHDLEQRGILKRNSGGEIR